MKVIIFLFFTVSLLFSDSFDDIAKGFLNLHASPKKIVSKKELTFNSKKVAYLYSLSSGGYIVVPISKNFSPIKAYSFKDSFEKAPKAYKDLILKEIYLSKKTRAVNKTILNRWNFLENFKQKSHTRALSQESHLLTTTWNQREPYNKYFPIKNGKKTVVGCVQVALGQLMKYYGYPKKGWGVFTHDGLYANLNRFYNWNIMPDSLLGAKEYQIDEVALLLKDLAVVDKANMGESTSAAPSMETMINNFGYSKNVKLATTDNMTKQEFVNLIKNQIASKNPLLLFLPGHLVVADGYKEDESGKYTHLNMGWEGSDDAYYNLDEDIDAGGYHFSTTSLQAIYDLKPCSDEANDCTNNLENSDSLTSNSIAGKFNFDGDVDLYKLYLKGDTTITGDRGYSNQAFYINLYDANHTLVGSYGETKNLSLNPGLYYVEVSLCSAPTNCFMYEEGMSDYTVNFISENLTSEEKEYIEKSLPKAPKINIQKSSLSINNNKKLLINSYTQNCDEDLKFEVFTNSELLDANFTNNILSLFPKAQNALTTARIKLSSCGYSTYKDIPVLINHDKIYYGKEFDIADRFNSQDDDNYYKVYLQGECSIDAIRVGYNGAYFFKALLDKNSNYLYDMRESAFQTSNLAPNLYSIESSLWQNPATQSGSFYYYDEDYANYFISVKCPAFNKNLSDIAQSLSISEQYTQMLSLNKGWNLVSLDLNISQIPQEFKILWKYKDKKWFAYSNNTTIKNSIKDLNISQITNIKSQDGVWIYSTSAKELNLKNPIFSQKTYKKGWTLSGSSKDIDVQTLTCENSSLKAVWKYKNNSWKLYLPQNQTTNIETFDTIYQNEGFWVDCK